MSPEKLAHLDRAIEALRTPLDAQADELWASPDAAMDAMHEAERPVEIWGNVNGVDVKLGSIPYDLQHVNVPGWVWPERVDESTGEVLTGANMTNLGAPLSQQLVDHNAPTLPPEEAERTEALQPLHALIDGFRARYEELSGLHGPGGKFENVRKQFLASLKVQIRAKYDESLTKVTDLAGRVDDEAHADPSYAEFLKVSIAEHQEYTKYALTLAMIRERINRTQALIYLSGQQMRLQ